MSKLRAGAVAAALTWMVGCWAGTFEEAQSTFQRGDSAGAVQQLKPLAAEGNPRAQGLLGMLTVQGSGTPRNVPEGMSLLQQSAQAGNGGAQGFLALIYLEGLVVPQDLAAAETLGRASAAQDNPIGQLVVSQLLLRSASEADWSEAISLLQRAASKPFPVAKYQLGKFVTLGWVVARDAAAGRELLDEASKVRALQPMIVLIQSLEGRFDAFRSGRLTPLSCTSIICSGRWGVRRAEAKRYAVNQAWPELVATVLAAEFATDQAYYYLGAAAEGMGFPEAARRYYDAAARAGLKCAGIVNNCDGMDVPALARSGVERMGTLLGAREEAKRQRQAEVERAQAETEAERRREALADRIARDVQSAQSGDGAAQFTLSRRYLAGDGVVQDQHLAMEWLGKAATSGYREAQLEMATRLLKGDGVARDARRAEGLLRKAHASGSRDAGELLASLEQERAERERRQAEAEAERQRTAEALKRERERTRRKESAEKVNSL